MRKPLLSRLVIFMTLALYATGCASVNSVAISSVPANRSQQVSAESSRWVILGFNFDNDYVDDVARDLNQKCPSGRISGILTKDEYYMYFLFFVLKRHIVATGFCEKSGQVASAAHLGINP